MPPVEFEPTISMLEWAKSVHALDRTATVIGAVKLIDIETREANLHVMAGWIDVAGIPMLLLNLSSPKTYRIMMARLVMFDSSEPR
jgi:hypothetical protein